MTQSKRFDCDMRITLPATLEAVEEFFLEFRGRSQVSLGRQDGFAAELLVREALTNAVMHGSGADPGKQVRCALRLRPDRLFVAVADDGEGFDWRAAESRTRFSDDCSGRGIEILRQYANRVRFNGKGNVVTMIKRFDGGKR
jgi:anti-sigma regulatory factor (Ser/Thr protein kinase)